MRKISFLAFAFILTLAGCSSSQRISVADRQKINKVVVSQKVEKPSGMYYLGPNIGLFFGAIGALVTADGQASESQSLQTFIEEKNISIEKIVLEESIEELTKTGKLQITQEPSESSSTLTISISQYGFSIPTGFSSELVPILNVKYTLVNSEGRTVWASSENTAPLGNPSKALSLKKMKEDPSLVEKSWRTASKSIVEKVAKTL